jgi:hypothetical protein
MASLCIQHPIRTKYVQLSLKQDAASFFFFFSTLLADEFAIQLLTGVSLNKNNLVVDIKWLFRITCETILFDTELVRVVASLWQCTRYVPLRLILFA